MFIGGNRKN